MQGTLAIAGDIAGAATALAGLILVYLGAMAASYGSYDAAAQADVRAYYRRHAWWAFLGLVIALFAAAFGLVGKATNSVCAASVAAGALFIAFIWAAIAALLTVRGIR